MRCGQESPCESASWWQVLGGRGAGRRRSCSPVPLDVTDALCLQLRRLRNTSGDSAFFLGETGNHWMDGTGVTDLTWIALALLLRKDCRARAEAGRPGRRLQESRQEMMVPWTAVRVGDMGRSAWMLGHIEGRTNSTCGNAGCGARQDGRS